MDKIQPIKTYNLPNGLSLIAWQIPHFQSAMIQGIVKVGSINEMERTIGINHLVEHLLFEGIPSHPSSEKLALAFEEAGGDLYGTAFQLNTEFSGIFSHHSLEHALALFKEMLLENNFSQNSFLKEKKIILNEIAENQDDSYWMLENITLKNRTTSFIPGFQPVIGNEPTIKLLSWEEVNHFYKRYYIPSNIILGILSPLSVEKTFDLVKRIFSKDQFVSPSEFKFPKFEYSKKRIVTQPSSTPLAYLSISFPGLTLRDPLKKRLIFLLLDTLLGDRRSTRLYKLLRGEGGLVYDFWLSPIMLSHAGVWRFITCCQPGKVSEVINLVLAEIDRLKKKIVEREELKKAITFVNCLNRRGLDDPYEGLDWLMNEFQVEQKLILPCDYIAIRSKITPQDIQAMAKEIFDYNYLNITIYGNIPKETLKVQY